MNRTLRLSPVTSLTDARSDGKVVAFAVGPGDDIYFVFARRALEYRTVMQGANFAITKPGKPQRYRVVGIRGRAIVSDIEIPSEPFNIHHVQPLGTDAVLLACSRSYYRNANDIEHNGRIYARDGTLRRELVLGDGIEDVQTTRDGTIWTSYFDEGIFGNYGWDQPIGVSGLIAWSDRGEKLFEFTPPDECVSVSDAYALNVTSDRETWLYYYTNFPLVRMIDRAVTGWWTIPVEGSHAFAVGDRHALFRGGYQLDDDSYRLIELGRDHDARVVATIELQDEAGQKLIAERAVGRGDSFYVLAGDNVYRARLADVLSAE